MTLLSLNRLQKSDGLTLKQFQSKKLCEKKFCKIASHERDERGGLLNLCKENKKVGLSIPSDPTPTPPSTPRTEKKSVISTFFFTTSEKVRSFGNYRKYFCSVKTIKIFHNQHFSFFNFFICSSVGST